MENQILLKLNIDDNSCEKKEEQEFYDGDKVKPFQILNWIAVAGHLASAIAMISVYEKSYSLPTTETYLNWTRSTCNETSSREVETANDGIFCIKPETSNVCDDCGIDLGWLIISFHLLSFLFQGLAGITDYVDITELIYGEDWDGYTLTGTEDLDEEEWGEDLDKGCCGYKYYNMIHKGKNPLRFIEYGFSAAIMLIAIALVNGVTDINLLASIGVLTGACQICGLVVEYVNDIKLKWILHFNGWLLFLCAYGIIYHAFSKAVNANDSIKPPDFVYVIVFILFALYSCFGMVQFTELLCETRYFSCCFCKICKQSNGSWCPACRKIEETEHIECINNKLIKKTKKSGKCNPLYKEMVYVTLSLGAKLVLGWLIFFNVLMNQ